MSRRLGIAAALICATALTAGCAPGPDPTPTPTGFTSQAEAFAAAEKTYRAYVDALNNVDLTDPATFEDVYKWETGDRLSGDKKALTDYYARGASMSGTTDISSLTTQSSEPDLSAVTLAVCVDVSSVQIRDKAGRSLVSEDRPDVQSVSVEVTADPFSHTGFLVSSVAGRTEGPTC